MWFTSPASAASARETTRSPTPSDAASAAAKWTAAAGWSAARRRRSSAGKSFALGQRRSVAKSTCGWRAAAPFSSAAPSCLSAAAPASSSACAWPSARSSSLNCSSFGTIFSTLPSSKRSSCCSGTCVAAAAAAAASCRSTSAPHSAMLRSSSSIRAPFTSATRSPPLYTWKVGIALIRPKDESSGDASTSTLTKHAVFEWISASCAYCGATRLQGPHHSAKKSTTTSFGDSDLTSAWKSSRVEMVRMVVGWRRGGGSRGAIF